MLSEKQKKMIQTMPKAENHIHIEGSIPWRIAIELADKNGVKLPYTTIQGIKEWTAKLIGENGLNGFMKCNRILNSSCITEDDFEEVLFALAKEAKKQNIIYQELHVDYPLNKERGIEISVVMNGYKKGKERAFRELGVDMVFIAGIDRTQSPKECLAFVESLEPYLDVISGLGLDCEEAGNPSSKFVECYAAAKKMGLFLTAHAGEDGSKQNVEDALNLLHVERIDHGCRAAEDSELMERLRTEKILCAMCPTSNVFLGAAKSYEEHPMLTLMRSGVPVSISTDDPPYTRSLCEEYEYALEKMKISEEELIQVARNGFLYSICGQKYLSQFDKWVAEQ